jgi:hypothetical protein
VRQFAGFLGRSRDTASVEDLRRYQLHLVDQGISPISLNAAITRRIVSSPTRTQNVGMLVGLPG